MARWDAFIAAGMAGEMTWLGDHRGARARIDGEGMLVGARTVVCLARRYSGGDDDVSETARSIARYARGRDYHKFLRRRLRRLASLLRSLGTEAGAGARARLLRRRSGLRAGVGGAGGPRLRRQERDAHRARRGVHGAARRGRDDPRARSRHPDDRAMRHVHPLPRRVPHPGLRRPLRPRRPAMHLIPHDRAPERDRRGAARAHRRPPLRLRRLPDGVPVQRRHGRARPPLGGGRRSVRAPRAMVARGPRGPARGGRGGLAG